MYVSIFRGKTPEILSGVSVFVVIAASIFMLGIYAALLRLPDCFRGIFRTFPVVTGNRTGLFGISIPYTLLNVLLNLFPTYIAYKYIGKRFTLYSIVVIVLSSIFVDILPPYMFTDDILLLSVFGGILNGFATSLCLNVGTTTGGTDFISIFFAHEKGIDAWNYILIGNVIMLVIAGALFGWSSALYSIIFQFCSTQVIQVLYKRYKKKHYLLFPINPMRFITLSVK